MGKFSGGRKKFLLSSTMGLAALALDSVTGFGKTKPERNKKKQLPAKLNILCVGAHPGDPEFGCGGTMVSAMLTMTAWLRSGRRFPLYFYEVNTGTETMAFIPTDYEDISGVRDRKKTAMFAHKTQAPEDIYDQYFKTLEEFRGLESGVKAAEAFIRFKPEAGRARIEGL